ncbi:MAG: hypothetical protein K8R46_07505 [Pirellulales bacterium]|nr:hypothetical protein [Pirellulales bacterium]
MPCTVIRPEDMADRILDRNKHPQWQGERTKMVYSFPTNESLWAKYTEIRAEGLRAVRHVVIDTNYWKSFTHARLAVSMGDRGCLPRPFTTMRFPCIARSLADSKRERAQTAEIR